MAARAIWKGVIRLGEPSVPVKLYAAVEDRGIHFRLLHEPDRVPLRRVMVNPTTGEAVPRERIQKGYGLEDGRFVPLDDEELEALEPEDSREIEVTRFLPAGTLPAPWYDRPYWLGPDGDSGAYFALARALAEEGREGIAHWTMRKKRYQGALRPEGDHLALVTLRHAEEVIPASALEPPEGRELSEEELEMARKLVSSLESDFDLAAYRDEYRVRVRGLVEAKAEGKTVELAAYREEREERASLLDALRESLERTGGGAKSA